MEDFADRLHRTWVQLLIDHDYREIAAIAVETEVKISYDGYNPAAIVFGLPTSVYSYVKNNERIRKIMERAMTTVSQGYIYDDNNCVVNELPYEYHVRLLEIEPGWQNVIRNLIANAQDPNQALITEKAFARCPYSAHRRIHERNCRPLDVFNTSWRRQLDDHQACRHWNFFGTGKTRSSKGYSRTLS